MQNALIAAVLVTVSSSKENALNLYELQTDSGKLEFHAKYDLTGSPGSQFVSPDGKKLYVSVRSAKSVAVFRIERGEKKLSPLGLTNIGANASYISTDKTGKTLLWASYSEGLVGSHALMENGLVKPGSLCKIKTKRCAHAILTDSSNRYAFVPHTGPNAVYQFHFNEKSGKLTKNNPLTTSPPKGLEPRHLAFHPDLPIVYCDDEKGDSVTAYHFNRDTGQLKAFHSESTLPVDFDGSQNTCADIEITLDGKFVYASNRGHNSIAGFSVDSTTGKLTSIGQFETGITPRSFNLSPGNNWMIAAGQRSHDLHVYKRNSINGKLKRVYIQPSGSGPSWVQFISKLNHKKSVSN